MDSTVAMPRDVFIVYSKGDPFESKLVEAIKEQLYNWGLTAWVYEDWDWEKESERGPRWRASGRVDQLDLIRYVKRHPEPFEYRPKGPQADRDTLAWMFAHCGAIVLIAPRGGSLSAGTHIEIAVLERVPHPAVASASWSQENERLVEHLQVFFDFRMPSAFPRDVSVAGESLARCA